MARTASVSAAALLANCACGEVPRIITALTTAPISTTMPQIHNPRWRPVVNESLIAVWMADASTPGMDGTVPRPSTVLGGSDYLCR